MSRIEKRAITLLCSRCAAVACTSAGLHPTGTRARPTGTGFSLSRGSLQIAREVFAVPKNLQVRQRCGGWRHPAGIGRPHRW